jgi:DNA transformation protein
MFGGWRFYHSEKMFALVASETFFVKVDDLTRHEFERHGLQPFVHETGEGQRTVFSHHTVPADALDDSAALCAWARKGIDAAVRAAAAKRKPPAKTAKSRDTRI